MYKVVESDTVVSKMIFGFIESGLAQNILATLIIYFHMLYINRLVIKHRLANQITLLPGLIYGVMVSFLPEYSLLTPFLIANTFVLIAIGQIFKTYKRPKAADILFNIGLLVALSSLFVPNYIFMILVGLVGLFVLRSMKMKELNQMILGSVSVYFAFGGILYLIDIDSFSEFSKLSLSPNFSIFENRGESVYKLLTILAVSIISVLGYGANTLKKSIQAQKKIDILYWFMMASLIMLFLYDAIEASQFLLLCVPLSILLNFRFISIKSPLVQEVIHICVVGLLFAFNFGLI